MRYILLVLIIFTILEGCKKKIDHNAMTWFYSSCGYSSKYNYSNIYQVLLIDSIPFKDDISFFLTMGNDTFFINRYHYSNLKDRGDTIGLYILYGKEFYSYNKDITQLNEYIAWSFKFFDEARMFYQLKDGSNIEIKKSIKYKSQFVSYILPTGN